MTFNGVLPAFSIIVLLCICAAIALYVSNRLIDRLADRLIDSGKYGLERSRTPRRPTN